MREQPEKIPKPLNPPTNRAEEIKLELSTSEMKPIIHMDGCLAAMKERRYASLCALAANRCVLYPQSNLITSRVWILYHDQNDTVKTAERAKALWNDSGFSFDEQALDYLIAAIGNPAPDVREAIALSIGEYCSDEENKLARENSISRLIKHYQSHKDELRQDPNDWDRKMRISKWTFRDGCSRSLGIVSRWKELEKHYVFRILDFLLKNGVSEHDNNVYRQNLDTGRSLLTTHGAMYAHECFEKLDGARQKVKNAQTAQSDWVRQGCVVFGACLVEQIEYDENDTAMNERIAKTMDVLVDTIVVPNQVRFECIFVFFKM